MAEHPPLNKIQRDVLFTVAHETRVERWNHPTLNYLRSLGLVTCEKARPNFRPGGNYRWKISELGKAVRAAPVGTPVPRADPALICSPPGAPC